MEQQDREIFGRVLMGTMNVYGKRVSDDAMAIWWAALQPFQVDEFRQALQAHIVDVDRGQYPPVPADVIRNIEELRGESLPARPAIEQKGEWAKLLRRYGIPVSQTAGMEGDQVWDLIQRAHKAQRSSRVQLRALDGGKE